MEYWHIKNNWVVVSYMSIDTSGLDAAFIIYWNFTLLFSAFTNIHNYCFYILKAFDRFLKMFVLYLTAWNIKIF